MANKALLRLAVIFTTFVIVIYTPNEQYSH